MRSSLLLLLLPPEPAEEATPDEPALLLLLPPGGPNAALSMLEAPDELELHEDEIIPAIIVQTNINFNFYARLVKKSFFLTLNLLSLILKQL